MGRKRGSRGRSAPAKKWAKRFHFTEVVVSAPYSAAQAQSCLVLNAPVHIPLGENVCFQEVNERVRALKGTKILNAHEDEAMCAIIRKYADEHGFQDFELRGDSRGVRKAIGLGTIFPRGGKAADKIFHAKHGHLPWVAAMLRELQPFMDKIFEWVDVVMPKLKEAVNALLRSLGLQDHPELLFGRGTYLDLNLTNISKLHNDKGDHPEVCLSARCPPTLCVLSLCDSISVL